MYSSQQSSVFQPGSRRTSGFGEWLPGFPRNKLELPGTKLATILLRGCSNTTVSRYSYHYESYWKLCLSIALTYCPLCVTKPYAKGFHELRNICGGFRCTQKVEQHCSRERTISKRIPNLGVWCKKSFNWTFGVGQNILTPIPSVVRNPTQTLTPPKNLRLLTTPAPQPLVRSSAMRSSVKLSNGV